MTEGSRHEHIAVGDENVVVADRRAAWKVDDRTRLGDVLAQRGDIEAIAVEDAAFDVAGRDDLGALFGQQMGTPAADIAKALDDDALALDRIPRGREHFAEREHATAPGRRTSAE